MTHRLTNKFAKNYCNRTLIVKVVAENVVTCFFGTHCISSSPVLKTGMYHHGELVLQPLRNSQPVQVHTSAVTDLARTSESQ